MNLTDLEKCLRFIDEAEKLKCVTRTSWTSDGRRESTPEHSWRLALMALLLAGEFPGLDLPRVLRLCLVHDLGEIYDGDISAALLPDAGKKYALERAAVTKICSLLPEALGREILSDWEDYDAGRSPEARLVKALDKAETIMQHNRGANPPDIDYAFNLEYGKEHFVGNELLENLRVMLDRRTAEKAFEKTGKKAADT